MNIQKIILFISFLAVLGWCSCKDAWEEHTELTNSGGKLNLAQQIAGQPEISGFNELLEKTGVIKTLSGGKVFTVWAPDNTTLDSLKALYPDYFSDSASREEYVKYHIAESSYSLKSRHDTLRLKTLSGKFRTIIGTDLEDSQVVKADIQANNGFIHIIKRDSRVKKPIWETVQEELSGSKFVTEMATFSFPNSQWSALRSMLTNENLQFTYFVLSDAAFTEEYEKIKPYNQTTKTAQDSTTEFFTKIKLYTDVIVPGLYLADNMPDTLVSVSGVKVPVSKSAILSSYRTSNGVIHLVNQLPYRIKDRVKGFKIEGEKWLSRSSGVSSSSSSVYRTLRDTSGALFTDYYVWQHRVANFSLNYRQYGVFKATYKVYARTVSGIDGDPRDKTKTFTQNHLGGAVATALTLQFSQLVDPAFNPADPNRQYREIYLGEYTTGEFGTLYWTLRGAPIATDNDANMVNLDYVRFEPILPN